MTRLNVRDFTYILISAQLHGYGRLLYSAQVLRNGGGGEAVAASLRGWYQARGRARRSIAADPEPQRLGWRSGARRRTVVIVRRTRST